MIFNRIGLELIFFLVISEFLLFLFRFSCNNTLKSAEKIVKLKFDIIIVIHYCNK